MGVDGMIDPFDEVTSDPFCNEWNPSPSSETVARPLCGESVGWIVGAMSPPAGACETVARVTSPAEAASADFDLDVDATAAPRRGAHTDLDTAATERINRPVVFPKLGEGIGGFRLVNELGRGAFARVYLAHEVVLGNRPVALKVSKAEGDEPKILARFQHTHIVPIHSVHDDPTTGLRLICMPYFGGANLAQLLEAAGARVLNQTQGKSLVDALDLVGQPVNSGKSVRLLHATSRTSPGPESIVPGTVATIGLTLHRSLLGRIPWWSRSRTIATVGPSYEIESNPSQPARQFLCVSSYVRASTWIAARLAEGLEHAHSRGLLHRDLKPANILIAADGTPMLLDFNLAIDAIRAEPEDGVKAMMGGTLPYMSPEHLDAFNPNGKTSPDAVDERSDIYALGLILFEMIAGRPAFAAPPEGMKLLDLIALMTKQRQLAAPSLRAANPDVPWSLDAIASKCLDPEPDRRYRSAGEFAEELRRFLDDQPLKFTREPSLREGLKKWSRRHPRASSASTILPVAAVMLLGIGAIAWTKAGHLRQVSARLNLRRFHETFQECQFLLNTASGADLTGHLRRGVDKAQAAIDRYEIARRGDWEQSYWVASLAPDERASLRQDLAELILLEARARVMLAEKEGNEDDRRRALEWSVTWLDRAEQFDPTPSPALFADRARYHRALGRPDLMRRDLARRDATPAISCRDEYLIATSSLALGRYDEAEPRLNRAVGLDPKRFWAWFALGICHYDQGRYADAVGDFNVCTVLMPQFAWPFANRGLALARSGRLVEACDSFDRAVALSPNFTDALAGRGLARLERGQADLAERDLARAIELGTSDVNVRLGRAEALAKLGRLADALALYASLIADRPADARLLAARGMARLQAQPREAEADFSAALALDPSLALAHYGSARVRYRTDRASALDHADQAIAGDPKFLDAVQLRALLRAHLGRADAVEDVDILIRAPTANRLFNASCAMAILARTRPARRHEDRAVDLLRRAVETGFPAVEARDDPDLSILRPRAEYRRLVGL